jgi:hypothetical protein
MSDDLDSENLLCVSVRSAENGGWWRYRTFDDEELRRRQALLSEKFHFEEM